VSVRPLAPGVLDRARRLLMPRRGNLVQVTFLAGQGRWRRALIPDDCVVGLCRELILQDIYALRPAGRSLGLVIDAGAHVGVYSLMASVLADRVIALEADPENFRILDLNLFRNGTDNVTAVNAALWSEPGMVAFERTEFTEGGGISETGGTAVPSISLDELIEQNGPVDCFKIDIEGAEFEVLAAATRLADVKTIVGELHVSEPAEQEGLIARLRGQGFDVELISETQLSQPRNLLRIVRNWRRIRGHLGIKLGALAYFATAGRLGATRQISRDMPLFVAVRR
jgi:FkbM family methyltransferase